MTRSTLLRIALVLAGASQLAATDCDHASDAGTRVSTAVHVVFGPFPTVGDPRAVHHLEHFLVGPDGISLGTPRVGTLEGWTGPDTLHLVWKGPATASSAACVAGRLASTTVDPTALHAQWSTLEAEVALERMITPPGASERLRVATAPPQTRYQLPLRGAVGFQAQMADLLADVPCTTVIAADGAPVRWTRVGEFTPQTPARIAPIDRAPGASVAWRITGTTDCMQRRALWAAVAGVAEITGGTPAGWLGMRGGVIGVVDAQSSRWRTRPALRRAQQWDAEAVRSTTRRSQEVGDRSWMAVGWVGLGVCPATAPLDADALRAGMSWLSAPTTLPLPLLPPSTGHLELAPVDWAAVWQAGAPPEGWLDHPTVYATRTPGGYTLDGPPDALASWADRHPPSAGLAPLDDVAEQALVLTGARAIEVPCRTLGPVDLHCDTSGHLRVPSGRSVVVVDAPGRKTVQVSLVRSVDPTRADVLADVHTRLGLESDFAEQLDAQAGVRDYRFEVEPVRVRVRFQIPTDHIDPILAHLLRVEEAHPSEEAAIPQARLAGRPWEAVHQPGLSTVKARMPAAPPAGSLLLLQGPAALLEATLAAHGVPITRTLSAAQLAAESAAIR